MAFGVDCESRRLRAHIFPHITLRATDLIPVVGGDLKPADGEVDVVVWSLEGHDDVFVTIDIVVPRLSRCGVGENGVVRSVEADIVFLAGASIDLLGYTHRLALIVDEGWLRQPHADVGVELLCVGFQIAPDVVVDSGCLEVNITTNKTALRVADGRIFFSRAGLAVVVGIGAVDIDAEVVDELLLKLVRVERVVDLLPI